MTKIDITLLIAVISAIIGSLIVARYKVYLYSKQKKKDDPVVTSIRAHALVEEQLGILKDELNIDRIWISQFHNGGNFYPTGRSMQKFSIMYELTSPGVGTISETYKSIPVSLFIRPLKELYENNEILISDYKKDKDFGLSTFTYGSDAKSSYIFALNSINDEFIGTLGIEYCSKKQVLNDEQLCDIRNKAITIGTLLSTYLYQTNS